MAIANGKFHKNGKKWQPTDLLYKDLVDGYDLEVVNEGTKEYPVFRVWLWVPQSNGPSMKVVSNSSWKTLQTAKRKAISIAWNEGAMRTTP